MIQFQRKKIQVAENRKVTIIFKVGMLQRTQFVNL